MVTTLYWSWWLSGLALAGVMLLHWLLMGRTMSVSGRYTALVGSWRRRLKGDSVDRAALLEAMRRATADEFGADAPAETAPAAAAEPAPVAESAATHAVFLVSVAVGGLVAALTRGGVPTVPLLRGDLFGRIFPGNPLLAGLVLLFGGVLVGAGTRMAGGCTSGHGLNGLSRLQPGSAVATAAFFAAGVVTSLLLGALL